MKTVIDLARNIRLRHNKPLKTPLRKMIIVHPDDEFLEDISGKLKEYVLEELNVACLVPCTDTLKYASLRAEPDFSALGKRLGKSMGKVTKEVKAMSTEDILSFEKSGEIVVAGERLKLSEIKITRGFKRPEKDMDAAGDGDVLVILDLVQDESLLEAGVARDVVCRIQKLRKKAGVEPTDSVEVFYESLDDDLQRILESQEANIQKALGSCLLPSTYIPRNAVIIGHETVTEISNVSFTVTLAEPSGIVNLVFVPDAIAALYKGNPKYGMDLQVYLLASDYSQLKSEFQAGKGKITVRCIENLPPVDVVLGEHVYFTVGEYLSTGKT